MSLIGALNIGKTALAAHQAAIQVTSNNIANAGNTGYTRQVADLTPTADRKLNARTMIGSGVSITSIERQIDDALEGRLRGSVSDSESANLRQQWLSRVEAVFNELGEEDLSTGMSAFFNAWSNLANKPQDLGLRQVVVQSGVALAGSFRDRHTSLRELQTDLATRMESMANTANSLLEQVADLNSQISVAEGGSGATANGLRDQRDSVLKQLAGMMDIKTQDMGNGTTNVFVGSEPLVLGTTTRGVRLQMVPQGENVVPTLKTRDDGTTLHVSSGQFGAMVALREEMEGAIGQVDDLAGNLIFELNKLHSSGQGLEGVARITATDSVDDATLALNDDLAGLEFKPVNGSFVVHVRQKESGLMTSTLIQVDLDGLNGDDTTLSSLRAQLDAVAGLSATITGGKLKLSADTTAVELAFSQDSSGTLAALGINTFFKGTGAFDIAINDTLKSKPQLLAASMNGQPADNQTARAIATLETKAIKNLNGATLKDTYETLINGIAVSAQSARTNAEAAQTIQETLLNQREALSGVSLDEEAINLMRQQRAFQGAARIITAVDEMLKTLLSI